MFFNSIWRSAQPTKAEDEPSQPATEVNSTKGPYGLDFLVEADDADADIVFVHGLTGNRVNTWTHRQSHEFWPKTLLPQDAAKSRIMTFGYDANIVGAFDTASSNTLRDHGKDLARDLAAKRARTNSETRPLIFIAHSLGGLVVEQALLISRGGLEARTKALLESTHGIIFMGTPHMGAEKAAWGSLLAQFCKLVRHANADIVRVLEPGSEMLATLQQEFHLLLTARARSPSSNSSSKKLEIFCFYEELPVVGVGLIVPPNSAILAAYENASIHATHTDMTKFAARDDTGYVRVCDQLIPWLREVAAPPPSVEAVRSRRNEVFGYPTTSYTNSNTGRGAVVNGNVQSGGDLRF